MTAKAPGRRLTGSYVISVITGQGSAYKPLKSQPFRRLMLSSLGSTFGDWATQVAIVSVIAYKWHLGAMALAAYAISVASPFILLSPVAGFVADRYPARIVLVSCDVARAIIVLALAAVQGLAPLIALVFAENSFSAAYAATRQKAIRESVADDSLMAANSLAMLSSQVTRIVAPGVAGAVLVVAGYRPVFALDSATYMFSAVILFGIRRVALPIASENPHPADEGDSPSSTRHPLRRWMTEATEGLRYILTSARLRVTVAAQTIVVFLVAIFDTLAPLALRELGYGSSAYGTSLALVGIGIIGINLVLTRSNAETRPALWITSGILGVGLCFAWVGIAVSLHIKLALIAYLPAFLGMGAGAAAIVIPYMYVIQTDAPAEVLGRVLAFSSAAPTAMQLVAPAIGASAASALSVGPVLAVSGCGLIAMGVATAAVFRAPATVDVRA